MRLQAESASELGVLLVQYSKPGSAHSSPTNGSIVGFEQTEELMFYWHPTKEELNQWVESKEREFDEKENKSPRFSKKDWLQKHIFTDLHEIFFATYAYELYDWLSKLNDNHIFKKKMNIV